MGLSSSAAVPLLHDNARGSKQLAVEPVPLLIDLGDDVVVFR